MPHGQTGAFCNCNCICYRWTMKWDHSGPRVWRLVTHIMLCHWRHQGTASYIIRTCRLALRGRNFLFFLFVYFSCLLIHEKMKIFRCFVTCRQPPLDISTSHQPPGSRGRNLKMVTDERLECPVKVISYSCRNPLEQLLMGDIQRLEWLDWLNWWQDLLSLSSSNFLIPRERRNSNFQDTQIVVAWSGIQELGEVQE